MDAEHKPGEGTPTIVAVFENLADAEYGLEALQRTGLRHEDVSLVVRDADRVAAEDLDGHPIVLPESDLGSNVASGAAAGAAVGGVVGGLASGLLALLVPGVGPILGTGILTNMLAGLVVGAAGGGILGALLGLGIPEEDAATYQEHVHAGRVLMTLTPTSAVQAQQIVDALDTSNAYDVRTYYSSTPAAPSPTPAAMTVDTAAMTPAVLLVPPVIAVVPHPAPTPAPIPTPTPVPATPPTADRSLDAPAPNPAAADPAVAGDVAALTEGGPDVRGTGSDPVVASRGLTDQDADLSAWRSGGDASRSDPAAERGLESAIPESEAVSTGGGDVVAVGEGGPDVRSPGADSRELTGATAAASGGWADDPTDWRSGGEAARADTGEGVGTDLPAVPAPAAPADRSLDLPAEPTPATPPPDDTYFTNPRLLSRSALRYAVPSDTPASRDLADAADPNPEGYGDANT